MPSPGNSRSSRSEERPYAVPDVDVRLVQVTKQYGDMLAVDHIDLEVRDGEFFSLLGPSG